MEKTLTVYWSNFSLPDRLQRTNLIVEPPIRLMQSFHKEVSQDPNKENASYKMCFGAKNLHKNTFVIKSPFDVNAKIIDSVIYEPFNLLNLRSSTYENAYSLEYDFQWIFFAEESVEIVQTPPYMHKTEASKYGIPASGSFDISKWFRQINATYNLYSNVNEFKIIKNEPIFYIDFRTDKKVILKQFDITLDLYQLAIDSANLKKFFPLESLDVLYNRFTRSNRNKKVIKEIKKTLLI